MPHPARPRRLGHILTLAATLLASTLAVAAPSLRIDTSVRHQVIDGFGTCLISWGNFPALYDRAFADTYVREMGLSMLRCELSGFTLPKPVGTPDAIDHRNFTFEAPTGRPKVFIDFARHLRAIDPSVRIIGTVWSPPPWMKYTGDIGDTDLQQGRRSGAIRGGTYGNTRNRVKPEFYAMYARWLVEMARFFEAHGAPLDAISPGNEVMFTQWFQSCAWTADDFARIVALLGDELDRAGLGHIRIFGPETMTGHNWSEANPMYLAALRANPDAWRHFDIVATHGYADGVRGDWNENSTREFWNMIRDDRKPFWITEGGTGGHNWPAPITGVAAAFHTSLVAGNASAILPWQISEERPSEHGLMVRDRFTKKSHAVRHFTRFIRPGAVRVDALTTDSDVKASAFVHPETRDLCAVLINPARSGATLDLTLAAPDGTPRNATLEVTRTTATLDFAPSGSIHLDAAGAARITLPPESITTIHGRLP